MWIDVFMAVDCLHEMKKKDINFYIDRANKIVQYFYYKCWKTTNMPFENIILTEDDYVVNYQWEQIEKEDLVFPNLFFHALYKVKN